MIPQCLHGIPVTSGMERPRKALGKGNGMWSCFYSEVTEFKVRKAASIIPTMGPIDPGEIEVGSQRSMRQTLQVNSQLPAEEMVCTP